MKFTLSRPLVFLDLETTGIDRQEARIVQIATCKVFPNFSQEEKTHLIDPGVPIPPEATAVHGITDAMVKGRPAFRNIARSFVAYLEECDVAGFNQRGFDLEILYEECKRAGVELDMAGRCVPDAMALFYHFHPRTLAAAVKVYLGVDFKEGHDALADVRATRDVLWAQLEEHALTIEEAAAICDQDRPLRLTEASQWWDEEEGGRLRFIKGKHRGKLLSEVASSDERDYLDWMLRTVTDVQVRHHLAMAQLGARRNPPAVNRVAPATEPQDQGSLGI